MSTTPSRATFATPKTIPTVTTAAVASILFCSQMAPVLAADLQIYGRAHLSTDVLGDGSDYGLNVSSNASRLGLRAEHQVHENLEVFMQLEQNVRFDQRGGEFASRNSFAGLRGDWGMFRLGSFDTPGKLLRAKADVFNDRLADLRNVASGDGMSFDPRFRNSIHYRSPAFYHTTLDVQYSPHNATGATKDNELEAVSVALNYQRDALWLAASFEQSEGPEFNPSAFRLGAAYDFTSAWQGILFYQHASNLEFGDRTVFGGGWKYRFDDYAIMGQAYQASANDEENTAATMVSVGFDYYISKELTLYTILGVTDNEEQATFSVSGSGRDTTLNPQLGNSASGLSLGLIYRF